MGMIAGAKSIQGGTNLKGSGLVLPSLGGWQVNTLNLEAAGANSTPPSGIVQLIQVAAQGLQMTTLGVTVSTAAVIAAGTPILLLGAYTVAGTLIATSANLGPSTTTAGALNATGLVIPGNAAYLAALYNTNGATLTTAPTINRSSGNNGFFPPSGYGSGASWSPGVTASRSISIGSALTAFPSSLVGLGWNSNNSVWFIQGA